MVPKECNYTIYAKKQCLFTELDYVQTGCNCNVFGLRYAEYFVKGKFPFPPQTGRVRKKFIFGFV